MTDELEQVEEAIKIGARNSRADSARIQAAHDTMVSLGAQCQVEPEVSEMPMMEKSLDELVIYGNAVKALGDGRVGGYLVQFGSPNQTDMEGEYFTASTDFGDADRADVYYHHGMDTKVGRRKLGKADLRKDEFGVWAETQLQLRDEYEQFIYSQVEAGKMGWSSGTASHLVERETVGKSVWLKSWPLGLDASLTPTPAEPRNTAVPLKSLFPQPSEPTGEAEASGEDAQSDGEGQAAVKSNIQSLNITEGDTMTPEEIQAMIDAAVDKATKAVVASLPPTNDGGHIEVTKDEGDQPFESAGKFFQAVKTAALYPQHEDPRLRSVKAPLGSSEGVPADGGYLLQTQYASGIMEKMHTDGQILSRVAQDSIGPNSNSMVYNGVDETSRATGSRWGGVRGYWLAEAGTKTSSKPTFMQIELKLKKVAALCYATDELLEDASALQGWLTRTVPAELRFLVEEAIMNGDGVGKPLGIMNSPCLVTQQRDTASRILLADILAMWSRRFAGLNDYVWFIGQDSFGQLPQLVSGTNVPVFMPAGGITGAPYSTIFGKPVIETEHNAALNTTGDIMLASMSQYQTITKGGVQAASSIHVQFVTDETAFRFVYRIDGQPVWGSALTPFNGGATQSPFVVLGSASA
jgi:HK97 family phage major capsid protein